MFTPTMLPTVESSLSVKAGSVLESELIRAALTPPLIAMLCIKEALSIVLALSVVASKEDVNVNKKVLKFKRIT